jgi:hypothetical protein
VSGRKGGNSHVKAREITALLAFVNIDPTIAQLEEHVTVDHGVAGSNPAGRISFWKGKFY